MSDPSDGADTPPRGSEQSVSADAQALVHVLEKMTKPSRDTAAFVAAIASTIAVVFTGLTFLFGPDSLSRDQTNKEIANCTKGVAVVGALTLPVNDSAIWEQRKARFWDYYTGERFLLFKVDIEPMLVRVDSLVRIEHITPREFVKSQDTARAYAALNDSIEVYARQIAARCDSLYNS